MKTRSKVVKHVHFSFICRRKTVIQLDFQYVIAFTLPTTVVYDVMTFETHKAGPACYIEVRGRVVIMMDGEIHLSSFVTYWLSNWRRRITQNAKTTTNRN